MASFVQGREVDKAGEDVEHDSSRCQAPHGPHLLLHLLDCWPVKQINSLVEKYKKLWKGEGKVCERDVIKLQGKNRGTIPFPSYFFSEGTESFANIYWFALAYSH